MGDRDKHLDPEVVRELRVVMGEDFRVLIDTFVADSERRLRDIEQAITAGDADALRRCAHSFKGSAGNMGAPALSGLCQELERLGREGVITSAAPTLEAARREYRAVCAELAALQAS